MPNDAKQSSGRRYESKVREEQRALTRQRLLDAFGALVREGAGDVTLPQIAKRAGVSAPTAYNHFPTVEELAGTYFAQPTIDFTPPAMATIDDLLALPGELFGRFEGEETLLWRFNTLPPDVQRRLSGRTQRTEKMLPMFRGLLGDLPPESARLVPALVRHLIGSRTWLDFKQHLGLESPEMARLVAWTLRVVLDELARDPRSLEDFEAP